MPYAHAGQMQTLLEYNSSLKHTKALGAIRAYRSGPGTRQVKDKPLLFQHEANAER